MSEESQEKKMIPLPMIGHHTPVKRVTRDTFLYSDPIGNKSKFAHCGSCQFWGGEERNTCSLFGPHTEVKGEDSCNYYMYGKSHGPEFSIDPKIDPEDAGFVKHRVQCKRCTYFDADGSYCELYEHLNKAFPQNFDLEEGVSPYGCCIAHTPGK